MTHSHISFSSRLSRSLHVDMNGNMHGWDYKALISSYNFVRLTSDEASQNGYIFSKQPFEASDWFVEFQTDIATTGRFAGDGMAFWFTERAYQPGQAFGHDEHFKGLGVFLDTYRNGDHAVAIPDSQHASPHL